METILLIFIILLSVYLIIHLGFYPGGKTAAQEKALRKRFFELARMPRHMAEDALERNIKSLSNKYPGKSRQWYLEKTVFDFEKDKY